MVARLVTLSTLVFALATSACQEYAEPSLTPGQQKKVQAHLLNAAPTPQHKLGAVIEDQVRLIGYDIDKTEVLPGEAVTVTYYLEALKDVDDCKIFVHFQGRKNDRQAWMNLDHQPIEGLLPLRQLKKGQIVKDVQTFTVKSEFPGGEAHIYWGLFKGNARLKIKNPAEVKHDGDNRVIVAAIKVKGPEKPKELPTATATRIGAGEVITLDGRLDEPVWQLATPTERFTSPDGSGRSAPETIARFVWDDQFVYVGVVAQDDDIWSTFTERDSNTWEQEVIELFIDADGDQKDYLELQVTPANVVFDARFERHRSDLAKARAFTLEGFETAVLVEGTLNLREDQDQRYTVELKLPIAKVPGARNPPQAGDRWRINLFRWDLPKTGRQVAGAFSPPVVGDFHALDRFGYLELKGDRGTQDPTVLPSAPQAPMK